MVQMVSTVEIKRRQQSQQSSSWLNMALLGIFGKSDLLMNYSEFLIMLSRGRKKTQPSALGICPQNLSSFFCPSIEAALLFFLSRSSFQIEVAGVIVGRILKSKVDQEIFEEILQCNSSERRNLNYFWVPSLLTNEILKNLGELQSQERMEIGKGSSSITWEKEGLQICSLD